MTTFFICMVPVSPVRLEPLHRSEQTSQLLFGEMCELLEQAADFVKVRVLDDGYEGWCQSNQLEETTIEKYNQEKWLAGDWVNEVNINDRFMHVPFASSLSFLSDDHHKPKNHNIIYNGISFYPRQNAFSTEVKKFACIFLNTPYLWGGRSVFGIDCSGFTQMVFKCVNIALLRDAHQQATQGETIESLEEAAPGDVAFFNNDGGKIVHTGILLTSNTIIHASGKVRIDTIDKQGIINNDNGKRTHYLKIIKRMNGSPISKRKIFE